jgi:phage terminase large subunit-like protein
VQANFANGMIYEPDRQWAELVITEMEVFPKGRCDDLTDSTTQAIRGTSRGRSRFIPARSYVLAFRLIRPADQR